MPVSVAARIFSRSCIGSLAIASRLPDSTVLNGSTFFSSGFCVHHRRDAIEAIHHLRCTSDARPRACRPGRTWRCAPRAARTSGSPGRWSPARSRRSPVFAGPSFHDGNRPPGVAVCACAEVGRSVPDRAGSTVNAEIRTRRLMRQEIGFMFVPSDTRDAAANCCPSGSSAFPWPGRPRSCPASAAAETPGMFAGAAPRSPAPEPGRTRARRTI